jgi:hypothetical protein
MRIRNLRLKIIKWRQCKAQSDGLVNVKSPSGILTPFLIEFGRNMEVLHFASSKWVYMLKSIEIWLCKNQKYKTVVAGAILNYSSILKFWKEVMKLWFQLQSYKWFRWKLTKLWNIRVWRPSWISPPFWSAIFQYSFNGLD